MKHSTLQSVVKNSAILNWTKNKSKKTDIVATSYFLNTLTKILKKMQY